MFHPFAVAVAICSCDSLLNTSWCKVKVCGLEVISAALFITFTTESIVNNGLLDKFKKDFKPVSPPRIVNEEQPQNIRLIKYTLETLSNGTDFNESQ